MKRGSANWNPETTSFPTCTTNTSAAFSFASGGQPAPALPGELSPALLDFVRQLFHIISDHHRLGARQPVFLENGLDVPNDAVRLGHRVFAGIKHGIQISHQTAPA